MEFLPANHLGAVGKSNDPAAATSPALKKGRFGLPPDQALAQKISTSTTNVPNTKIKEAGHSIIFNGEKLPENPKTTQLFEKNSFTKENTTTRSGEIIIKKEVRTTSTEIIIKGEKTKNLNGSSPITSIHQSTEEIREIRLTEIKAKIKNGTATIVIVNHETKTINFEKINKNADLTKLENAYILAGKNIVLLGTDKSPTDVRDYHATSNDKSLQKDLSLMKQNFIEGDIFVATSDEIKLLNDLNKNRTEPKKEEKKSDNTISQNVKSQKEANIQQSSSQSKRDDNYIKQESALNKNNSKSIFSTDEEKSEKAKILRHNQEVREERQESAHNDDKKNQQSIDERVIDSLKQKK